MYQVKLKSLRYGVSLFLIVLTFQSYSKITKGNPNPFPEITASEDNLKGLSDHNEFRVDIANQDGSSSWGGHIILKDNKLYKTKDHEGNPLEDLSLIHISEPTRPY